MNSLAIESLLKVDDDVTVTKTLKVSSIGPDSDGRASEQVVDEDATIASPALPEAAPVGPAEIAISDEGKVRVLKSYAIGRWCSAQVLEDAGTGQYRYELIEPQLSPADRLVYEAIVVQLHKKPRSALEEMRRIGGRQRILQHFERLCLERGVPGELKEKMAYCLERDFWGYKKIHGLLRDPNIEDISCNGYHSPVFVYLPDFESVPTNVRFATEEELDDFVMYLVQKGGKSINAANPIQDVALPDGSRLNVTLYREVSSGGTTFSVRLANRARGVAELLRQGTFSPEAMAFLWLALENRCSMAFIGGTASGKTAALNAVAGFIVDRNKVVTIEDTREVRLSSQNWTPLIVREAGDVPITEFHLLVAAFRQRPEYVIIGEVRTPEGARAAIHGINSGHTVVMTFHADSPSSFFNRITNDPFNVSPHIAAGVSLCINLSMVTVASGRSEAKVRRCRSIGEVAGVEAGKVAINQLFEWDPATDAMLMMPEQSAVIRKIREERGWSDRRVIEEIAGRTAVLRWMAGNGLSSGDAVRKTVEAFHRDRGKLLERIRVGGRSFDAIP